MADTKSFEFCGHAYPLCCTVACYAQLSKLTGDGNMSKALPTYLAGDGGDMASAMDHCCRALACLISGGEHQRQLHARFMGNEDAAIPTPTAEDLMDALSLGDVIATTGLIYQAVVQSFDSAVKVDDSKNVRSGEPR